ncbi:MAG TPA: polyprenol monophosphomannose synthase [Ardenticatenaceae bacterium]|nr:polyprenol monophosphomannose synthase [Ardenticatenaceae bacterium]
MRTTIVIPTYNEAENLEAMVAALLALPLEAPSLIVVDDNSPDGTGQIADRLAGVHPDQVAVIHRDGKLGLGTAYQAGFRRALAGGAEAVIQMDADFSHSPRYIPGMIEALAANRADVLVGSRYVPGGQLDERWSWWRYLLSWWANQVYSRALLNLRVKDATAGFKAWRRGALEAIDLNRVRSNGYVFQVEMAYLTEKLGLRVLEIPIYFEDRRIGRSKMTVPVKIEAVWRVWQIRWRHRNAIARAGSHLVGSDHAASAR